MADLPVLYRPLRALVRALGLAHYWQRLLDEQRAASVAAIATAEGVDVTQVRRLLRLTLLAPAVIDWLVGTPEVTLEQVMRRPWPLLWAGQEEGRTGDARLSQWSPSG